MRLMSGLLTLCLLSSCYGMDPKAAEIFEPAAAPVKLPADPVLALLSTDGQFLSPAGPAWQQAGLKRMYELLQSQGLKLSNLASAAQPQDMLSQGFPELSPPDTTQLLNATAKAQQADLVILLKQTPKPDIRVDLFTRQMRYNCDVALQVYSPAEQRYLYQIHALGENGYTGLMQTAALLGMITTTVATPAIRLGYGAAQQQQGTQVANMVQIAAGAAIIGLLAWDISQGVTPPEQRQLQACDQALQEAAKGLVASLK